LRRTERFGQLLLLLPGIQYGHISNKRRHGTNNDLSVSYTHFVVNCPCDTNKQADSQILMSVYSNNYTTRHSGAVFFNYFDSRRSNSTTRTGKITSLIQLTQTDKLFSDLAEVKGDSVSSRPEFSAVSSQLAQSQPSSTAMADYTPTRTAQSSCESVLSLNRVFDDERQTSYTTKLHLATAIPPKPDPILCNCMMESLECAQNSETMVDNAWSTQYKTYYRKKQITTEANLYNAACSQTKPGASAPQPT
jgi:hypothetical protein